MVMVVTEDYFVSIESRFIANGEPIKRCGLLTKLKLPTQYTLEPGIPIMLAQ